MWLSDTVINIYIPMSDIILMCLPLMVLTSSFIKIFLQCWYKIDGRKILLFRAVTNISDCNFKFFFTNFNNPGCKEIAVVTKIHSTGCPVNSYDQGGNILRTTDFQQFCNNTGVVWSNKSPDNIRGKIYVLYHTLGL